MLPVRRRAAAVLAGAACLIACAGKPAPDCAKVLNDRTIDDAAALVAEIKQTGAPLQAVQDALLAAKERGEAGVSFRVHDGELTATLEGLKLQRPDPGRLFHSVLYGMEPKDVEDLFAFYMELAVLYERVDRHVRLSKADALKAPRTGAAGARPGGAPRYAVVFSSPRPEENVPPIADVVELGAPVCPADQQPHPEGCGDGVRPLGFQYRPDPSSTAWGSKPWGTDGGGVVLLGDGGVTRALLAGAEPFVGELAYLQRLVEIDASLGALLEARKRVLDRLERKAHEPKAR